MEEEDKEAGTYQPPTDDLVVPSNFTSTTASQRTDQKVTPPVAHRRDSVAEKDGHISKLTTGSPTLSDSSSRTLTKKNKRLWLKYSLISAVCITISSWLISGVSIHGVRAKFIGSMGYLMCSIFLMVIHEVRFYRKYGVCSRIYDTPYFNKNTLEFKKYDITLAIICGLLSFFGELFCVLSFGYAVESGLGQGVMAPLLSVGTVIVVIGSLTLFKEGISFTQSVAVIGIVVGLLVLCVGSERMDNNSVHSVKPVVQLLLAISASICFAARTLVVKGLSFRGVDNLSSTIAALLFDGILGSSIGIIYLMNDSLFIMNGYQILLCFIAGALSATGINFLNLAVTVGHAGSAFAMSNIVNYAFILIDWLFNDIVEPMGQILGMLMILMGLIFVSVGDMNLIGCVRKNSTNDYSILQGKKAKKGTYTSENEEFLSKLLNSSDSSIDRKVETQ